MNLHIMFQDPSTIYGYSLIYVHHQVMWYMFLILGVVYWCYYRIIKEYNWHSFNKQNGLVYLYSYINGFLLKLETQINYYINTYWPKRYHERLSKRDFKKLAIFRRLGRKRLDPVFNIIHTKRSVRRAVYAARRFGLSWIGVISYHTGNTMRLATVMSVWPDTAILLSKELTLAKYWYCSAYNQSTNGYTYSFYSKEGRDFLEVQAYRDNIYLELIWAFFPSLIIFLILIPSLYLLYSLEENFHPKFNIKTIGHQWFWSYEFDSQKYNLSFEFDSNMVLEEDLAKGSRRLLEVNNRLYLPLNIPLRILVTSSDVLHSWAVPEMGIKVDAVPGRLNDSITIIRRPGVFYGQCSELCGVGHAFMPIVVEACGYKKWMKILKSL